MTRVEALTVLDQAVSLRDNLRADIANALTRNEHIRLTQLAAEAERLVATIELLLAVPVVSGFQPTHMP